MNNQEYKGVRDFYPEDWRIQKYIFEVWSHTLESFGYAEYNASILEPTELYEAKTGEEIVNEQTYTFLDRGGRSVTLRPEMTPTVSRMVAKRERELAFPLRLYSIPNLFRYERPQRGRLREHYQLNADIFGVSSKEAEIEMITISNQILKNFGLSEDRYEIKISSRKLINAIFSDWYELDEVQSKMFGKLIDRKNKMPHSEFEEKAREIVGDGFKFLNLDKKDELYEEAMAMPMIREAKNELDEVINNLKKAGITNIVYDAELIRGFDYYTGIVFEIFDNHKDNNRSIFGGGRYDGLVSLFGGKDTPAVGFGMGDVMLKDVLETYNLLPEKLGVSETDIYVCVIDENNLEGAKDLAKILRENKLNVAIHLTPRKLGDQIKQAEKQKITHIIIVGEDETKSQVFPLKNIVTGVEERLSPAEIIARFK